MTAATDVRRRVLRFQSCRQLFPQVFRYVEEYVRRKVNFNGAHLCELGLEEHVKHMVERVRDGIVPDESEDEPTLMPILNRYKPIGTTAEVDFKTTPVPRDQQEPHRSGGDGQPLVGGEREFPVGVERCGAFYAGNDHLGLLIPYEYVDIDRPHESDYPFFGLLLSPMIAAAAMSFSSVSAVGTPLRLRGVEARPAQGGPPGSSVSFTA